MDVTTLSAPAAAAAAAHNQPQVTVEHMLVCNKQFTLFEDKALAAQMDCTYLSCRFGLKEHIC